MKSKSTIFSKPPSNSIAARPCVTILLAFGGVLAFSGATLAGTAKWTGAGTAPSPELGVIWSDNGNWDIPPVTGDDLLFAGILGLTNYNNLGMAGSYSLDTTPVFTAPAFTANRITFDPVSDGFVLSGNDIFFNGKTITNNSPNLQTLNFKLQENGNGIIADGTGDLYLSGLVTNSFSRVFTKNGTGTVTVDGTYDYQGIGGPAGSPLQLTVNAGKLVYRGGIFGTVNVGNATTGAALESNGANWHFNTTCRLNNAASSLGFTVSTPLGELDAVAGSMIKGLAQGGTIIIDFNQDQTRVNDIAGNFVDGDQGGRLGVLLGPNGGSPRSTAP